MAIRQDQVQLSIEFITDESRALARTLLTTKQYNAELAKSTAVIGQYQRELAKVGADEAKRAPILAKIAAEEKKIADNLGKVAEEGKKVEALDLSKVAPAQLVERAKQLQQAMRLIPQSAPQFRELQGELGRVNAQLKSINDTSKGISAGSGGAGGGLFQRILGVAGGIGVFQLAQQAIGSLINFGRTALQELDGGLKADAQVKAAIESTKGAAGRSFEELKTQAEELAKVTLFGDDATKGAQALLLTFKNVKTEIFDQAIPLAQDLSTAFGQDLNASAIQLGKALDNPIQGVTALRRVGVSFTEDQQTLIKSLVETGRTAEAQTLILAELESQVGGSAKAAAEAGLGPYQILQNRLGEVQESIGGLIANGLQKLAPFLLKVVEFVEQLVERFTSGKRATGEFSTAVELVAFSFNVVAKIWQLAGIALEQVVKILRTAGERIGDFIGYVRELPVVGELFEQFIITPIRFIADAIENLPAAWAGFVAATKQAALNVVEDLKGLVLDAKIFVKNIESALTFSAAGKLKIGAELSSLESQKVAAKAGKTIGQAYIEARDAVLANSATGTATDGTVKKPGVTPTANATPEEIEAARKRVEDRLKVELQAIELGIQRKELLIENERIKGLVDEAGYQAQLAKITEDGLRKKLDVYKVFHRDQTNEALKLQNELAVIEQGSTLGKVAINTISGKPIGGVKSQATGGGTEQALGVQDLGENAREQALAQRFQRMLITEQDYELQRLELKKQALAEEIAILKEGGPAYSAAVRKKEEEALKIDEEIKDKRIDNAQRLEDAKIKIQQAGFQAAAGFFSLAADLLSQDEKARKKNATAIKAFQSAEVITNGILEAQRSYAEAVKTFGLPAGPVLGAIFAGLAVGRSIVAVNKINATKFFGGGFTGSGFGAPDESGSRIAGYVHAGEYVAPAKQVNDPETGPVVRWLNDRRLRGYASGGFVAPNTTPSSSISFGSSAAAPVQNLDSFMNAVSRFEAVVARFPTEVKSRVVYTELETAGSELNAVRDDASL
jgi:hypothetical protein